MRTGFAAALMAAAVTLAGCNAIPKDIPIYQGLLPDGYEVKTSTAPVNAADLKTRKLVVLASENFNAYTTEWTKMYDPERLKGSAGAAIFGANYWDGMRKNSDPRILSDQMVSALRPYFAEVGAATDFPAAKTAGADYFAVLDYRGYNNEMGDHFVANAKLNLLDGQLTQIASIAAKSDVAIPGMGMLDLIPVDLAQAMEETYAKTIASISTQLRSGLAARLGPPQ